MRLSRGVVKKRLYLVGVIVALALVGVYSWLYMKPVQSAVGFVAASTAQTAASTSFTIAAPSGAADGDLLVMLVSARGGTGVIITTPSGWLQVSNSSTTSSTLIRSSMYYKYYSSGDTTYSIKMSTSQKAAAVISAYRGVETVDPVDRSSSAAKTSASPMVANSVTTTLPNTMTVTAFASTRATTFTAGSGSTMRGTTATSGGNTATNTTVGLQDYNTIQAMAGTSVSPSMNTAAAADYIVHTIALKPYAPMVIQQSLHKFFQVQNDGTLGAQLTNTVDEQQAFSLRSLLSVDGRHLAGGDKSFALHAAQKSAGVCGPYSSMVQNIGGITRYPTNAQQDNSNGGVAWGDAFGVGNHYQVLDEDGISATVIAGTRSLYVSAKIITTGYAFNLPPGSVIAGVKAHVVGRTDALASSDKTSTVYGQLAGLGGVIGLESGGRTMPWASIGEVTLGDSADRWGTDLTVDLVNSTDFGFSFYIRAFDETGYSFAYAPDVLVDAVKLTVYYTQPSTGGLVYETSSTPADASYAASNVGDPSNSRPVDRQRVVRNNPFSNYVQINAGTDGLWDFRLYPESGSAGKTYCLKIVNSDGSPLDGYGTLPEITITSNGPSLEQRLRGGQAVREGQSDTPLVAPGTPGW